MLAGQAQLLDILNVFVIFVLTDCSRFVNRIKVVSRFVSVFLPVEIIRMIWYFVICSELCSIVLEMQISIRKKIRIKYGVLFSS